MITKVLGIVALTALMMMTASCKPGFNKVELQTEKDTADYYRGLTMGDYLRDNRYMGKFNYEAFLMGMEFAIDTEISGYEEALIEAYVDVNMEQNRLSALQKEYRRYIKENEAFLEENAKKDSVVSLPSGIQYKVLKEGHGEKPASVSRVTFYFSCRRIDGTLIEDNYDAEPISYGISALLPGWREVIQLMPEGSKWEVVIPADLLYGSEPPENSGILPFSTLIYDIELVGID